MKQDNIFRFIAVRPAVAMPDEHNIRVKEDPIGKRIVEQLEEKKRHDNKNHKEARESVARTIIDSPDYIGKSSDWQDLVSEFAKFKELTDRVRRMQQPDINLFVSGATDVIRNAMSDNQLTIPSFLASQRYQLLKSTTWHSYYALVLDPTLNPMNREQTALGLKLFTLLEATDDKDTFLATVRRFHLFRPDVPPSFLLTDAVQQRSEGDLEDDDPQSPSDVIRKKCKKTIEDLDKARDFLLDLQRKKHHRQKSRCDTDDTPSQQEIAELKSRMTEMNKTITELSAQAASHAVQDDTNKKEKEPVRVLMGAGGGSLPPWQLTLEEIADVGERFSILRELGLGLSTTTIPELVQGIDKHVAVAKARLVRESNKTSVVLNGRTWVRRRKLLEES